MTEFPSIEELLPHRAPMILVDAVESFDIAEKSAVVRVDIKPKSMFCDGESVPSWVAIEYMAQATAALVGLRDREMGVSQRPGLLLGTRKMTLDLDAFAIGHSYRITSKCEFEDGDAGSFGCKIFDDEGKKVAEAVINAYRPPNLKEFLEKEAI